MKIKSRKELVLGLIIVLVNAACIKQEYLEESKEEEKTYQVAKDFQSLDDASRRISGSLNSIVTARVVTARMTTPSGEVIEPPLSAPRLRNIDEMLLPYDIIASKLLRNPNFKLRTRISHKRESRNSETVALSCERFISQFSCSAPECEEGKATFEPCDISNNKVKATLSAQSCKQKEKDKPDQYVLYSGKVTIFAECVSRLYSITYKVELTLAETSVEFFEGNQKSREFVFHPYMSYKLQESIRFSGGEVIQSSEVILNGYLKETSAKGNIEQNTTFRDLKTSFETRIKIPDQLSTSSDEEILPSDIDVSINGTYLTTTNPTWCGDGEYEISTLNVLKINIRDEEKNRRSCPHSGTLKVNNSEIQFTGNKVKITVGEDKREYTCEELSSVCPYPDQLEGPYSILPLD